MQKAPEVHSKTLTCSACSEHRDALREWQSADAEAMSQLVVDANSVARYPGKLPNPPLPPACWNTHVTDEQHRRLQHHRANPTITVYERTLTPNGRVIQPGVYTFTGVGTLPKVAPRYSNRAPSAPREYRSRRSTGTSNSRGDPPDDPDPKPPAKAGHGLPTFAEFATWPLPRRYRYMWKAVRDDDRLNVTERESMLMRALYPGDVR